MSKKEKLNVTMPWRIFYSFILVCLIVASGFIVYSYIFYTNDPAVALAVAGVVVTFSLGFVSFWLAITGNNRTKLLLKCVKFLSLFLLIPVSVLTLAEAQDLKLIGNLCSSASDYQGTCVSYFLMIAPIYVTLIALVIVGVSVPALVAEHKARR